MTILNKVVDKASWSAVYEISEAKVNICTGGNFDNLQNIYIYKKLKEVNSLVILERATKDDAEVLIEVKKRAFVEEFELYGSIAIPPKFDDINNFKNIMEKSVYYKIILNNEVVGGLCVEEKSPEHYELVAVYIDSRHQNTGIGTKVVKKMEEMYYDVKRWTLDTPYKSYRNHHFYEKMGYKKIDQFEPEFAKGTGFILILFEKLIA